MVVGIVGVTVGIVGLAVGIVEVVVGVGVKNFEEAVDFVDDVNFG
jgi:hypothetical protein